MDEDWSAQWDFENYEHEPDTYAVNSLLPDHSNQWGGNLMGIWRNDFVAQPTMGGPLRRWSGPSDQDNSPREPAHGYSGFPEYHAQAPPQGPYFPSNPYNTTGLLDPRATYVPSYGGHGEDLDDEGGLAGEEEVVDGSELKLEGEEDGALGSGPMSSQPAFNGQLLKHDIMSYHFGHEYDEPRFSGGIPTEDELNANLSASSMMVNGIGRSQDPETEFHRVQDKLLEDKRSTSRVIDASFPTTAREQEKLVMGLYTAIHNVNGVLDKQTKNNHDAQAVKRFKNHYYTPRGDNVELKMTCWGMLYLCRDAQLGIRHTDSYHQSHSKVDSFDSFIDRWNAVVAGCAYRKSVCKQLLDQRYAFRLVEAPAAETSMKESNEKVNGQRNLQNNMGRNAMRAGLTGQMLAKITASGGVAGSLETDGTPQTPEHDSAAATLASSNKDSTLKRKLGGLNIDAASPATPTKKPRSSSRRTGGRSGRGASQLDQRRGSFIAQTPTSRGSQLVRRSSSRTAHPSQPTQALPQNPTPTRETIIEYKKVICEILDIDFEVHGGNTLFILGSYARQFNADTPAGPWTYIARSGLTYEFNKTICTKAPGQAPGHPSDWQIGSIVPEFYDIAVARQDVQAFPSLKLNEPPKTPNYFHTGGNLEKVNALQFAITNVLAKSI